MIEGLRMLWPTAAEVRAASLAIRRTVTNLTKTEGQKGPTDETLVSLIDERFETVDETYRRLQETEAYLRECGDRRSVFLTVYAAMTGRVERGIESGAFEDPTWVRSYLVDFANRYREVLLAFERGRQAEVPTAWRLGFGATVGGRTVLIQDALLGINAHINYDLPFTLRAVSIDPNRDEKRRDHRRINGVLAQLVDVVQRSLVDVYGAEVYARLDRQLGAADEQFTLFGLREARTLAWRNAVGLVDRRSRLLRRLIRWQIGLVATGCATFILSPTTDPTILEVLRNVESEDPPLDRLVSAFKAEADALTVSFE